MDLQINVTDSGAGTEVRAMGTIRVGIFGCMRGGSFPKAILMNNGEIVALCDRSAEKMEQVAKELPEKPAFYTNFDAFLEHDMDAVILANYFHEHAPYAIRCLDKGLHVLSEGISNSTMAEGVALVRAAERSQAVYMLGENYPFLQFNQEINRVYRNGVLGKALYAEGEYNHPFDPTDAEFLYKVTPRDNHWRNHTPSSYYITHSLSPLMYTTGARPVRVTALPVFSPEHTGYSRRYVADTSTVITCINDDDSVFRVMGWSSFGAEETSFRICGTKGQIENLRSSDGKVMVRYNAWDIPEGEKAETIYKPDWQEDSRTLLRRSGIGAEYFLFQEFFRCIRAGTQPVMDVYFAVDTASVGILGHRSMLQMGMPYDIPDFRKEEDRAKYENDHLTPFWDADGNPPTIPSCSRSDFRSAEK